MSESTKKAKPQFGVMRFADVSKVRLPLAALVSILHRVSGAMMFVLLPFVLFLLDRSLLSEDTFLYMKGVASNWFVKLVILALAWAYLHHFSAGIRHLFMDLHIGLDKESARKSSVAVFAISLPLALLVALKLFGAF